MLKPYQLTFIHVYMGLEIWDKGSKILRSGRNMDNSSQIWVFLLYLLSLKMFGDVGTVIKTLYKTPISTFFLKISNSRILS